jgi:hypothetical protein
MIGDGGDWVGIDPPPQLPASPMRASDSLISQPKVRLRNAKVHCDEI